MNRWIIIHKFEEGASEWGFGDNSQYGRAIAGNTAIALIAPSVRTAHDAAGLEVSSFNVVVFSRGRYENLSKDDRIALDEWLRPLADGNNRVWVHFGGTPAQSMADEEVKRRWSTELRVWHPIVGVAPMLLPYSVMSENSDDDTLKTVRAQFKQLKDGVDAREQVAAILDGLTRLWIDFQQARDLRLQREDLESCIDAYVAFRQFLIAAEANEVEKGSAQRSADSQDQLEERLAVGQADAMRIARTLKAELESDHPRRQRTSDWLLLLEAIVRSEADPSKAMREFCDMLENCF